MLWHFFKWLIGLALLWFIFTIPFALVGFLGGTIAEKYPEPFNFVFTWLAEHRDVNSIILLSGFFAWVIISLWLSKRKEKKETKEQREKEYFNNLGKNF